MIQSRISIPKNKIEEFCKRNHIRKLSLFGSVLRSDFRSNSDVDILVEFEPNCRVGFFRLSALELELSKMLGRKADLRTPAELSLYFRQDVLKAAQVQYAQG